jgi:hypothetical protein
MPRGFSEGGKVLKLKKSLYGLKQSSRNFYQHLKTKLEKVGFTSMEDVDPCLFISDKVICLVYVDDCLFYSPKAEYIDEMIQKLRENDMTLEVEDSVAGFLGVHIDRNDNTGEVTLTQTGLIERIIKALGVECEHGISTPAAPEALHTDKDGDPAQSHYSYSSVIGMLQCLQGHSRPDITYAVSQCSRFIHCAKRSHEIALERIGRCLKKTRGKGLILKPSKNLDIDCYVDADFCGLWSREDAHDPVSVKSRTGFAICIANCPIVWSSRLQNLISLSTMESEYVALSEALKFVLPIQNLVQTVAKGVGLPPERLTTFKTTIWEDNMGALTLGKLEPGRCTPRSKHYAVKIHWFRSYLKPNHIEIMKIDTKEQRADILTKGLKPDTFEKIRKLLCGW